MEPAAASEPEPKVVAVKTEMLDEDYIQWLMKNPFKRLPPPPAHHRENLSAAYAVINKAADVREDIVKQYKEKGYAIAVVGHLDNGQKRLIGLPEQATTA